MAGTTVQRNPQTVAEQEEAARIAMGLVDPAVVAQQRAGMAGVAGNLRPSSTTPATPHPQTAQRPSTVPSVAGTAGTPWAPYDPQQSIPQGSSPGGGNIFGTPVAGSGGQGYGGTHSTIGTPNLQGVDQFIALAMSNPSYAQLLADMGAAPTINGVYGGGWVKDNRAAQGAPGGAAPAAPGSSLTQAQRSSLASQGLDADKIAAAAAGNPTPNQVARYGSPQAAQAWAQGLLGTGGSGGMGGAGGLIAGGGGGAGAGGPGVGGMGQSISGYLASPGPPLPSATGFNPFDPSSATKIAEANRQAAVDELRRFGAGVGGSPLSGGLESAAVGLLRQPEAISDETQRMIESRAIEASKAGARDQERLAREDIGAAGRTGTGVGMQELSNIRRGAGADLNRVLSDLQIQRAVRRNQDIQSAMGSAGGAFEKLAGVGGANASKIADILAGTDLGDSEMARLIFQAMLGQGGGYGISGA